MKRRQSPWAKAVKIEKINRGWSDQDIADAAHLSRNYVCAVINGRTVSPPAIRAISCVLGIDVPDEYADDGNDTEPADATTSA